MDRQTLKRTSSVLRYSLLCLLASILGYLALFMPPPLREELQWGGTTAQVQRGVVFIWVVLLVCLAFRRPILTWKTNFRRFLLAVFLPLPGAVLFHFVDLVSCWLLDRRITLEQLMAADTVPTIAESSRSTLIMTVTFGMVVLVPLGMLSIYVLQLLCEVEPRRGEAI